MEDNLENLRTTICQKYPSSLSVLIIKLPKVLIPCKGDLFWPFFRKFNLQICWVNPLSACLQQVDFIYRGVTGCLILSTPIIRPTLPPRVFSILRIPYSKGTWQNGLKKSEMDKP
jgi:hypothetical protein